METVYIETSVVSYLVSRPSRDIVVAGHQATTRDWWETRRPLFSCFVSEIVVDEAGNGDPDQAALRLNAVADIPRLAADRESAELTKAFLRGGLPAKAADDAAHLAIATVSNIGYLVTWNCRHLANGQVLKRLDKIASAAGFKLTRVCTPESLMGGAEND